MRVLTLTLRTLAQNHLSDTHSSRCSCPRVLVPQGVTGLIYLTGEHILPVLLCALPGLSLEGLSMQQDLHRTTTNG